MNQNKKCTVIYTKCSSTGIDKRKMIIINIHVIKNEEYWWADDTVYTLVEMASLELMKSFWIPQAYIHLPLTQCFIGFFPCLGNLKLLSDKYELSEILPCWSYIVSPLHFDFKKWQFNQIHQGYTWHYVLPCLQYSLFTIFPQFMTINYVFSHTLLVHSDLLWWETLGYQVAAQ